MTYAKDTATALDFAERYLKLAKNGFGRAVDETEATPINCLIEALHFAGQAGTSWWPSRRKRAGLIWSEARHLLLDNTNGYSDAWNESFSQ